MAPLDPVGLHVAPSLPSAPVRVVLYAVAGLLATVAMNVPMRRQSEGSTPPFVAAAVLFDRKLTEVPAGAASAVHYAAGTLAGALFALLAMALEAPVDWHTFLAGTDVPALPHALAGLLVLGFLYGVFSWLVLPRAGFGAERAARVRRQWFVSATVYVAVLLVAVPAVLAALA